MAAEPPNSSEILQDFTKTAATLASGLLVLTVTFAEKVLGNGSVSETRFLLGTWILLIVAMLFSILSTASLRNHLLDKETSLPTDLSAEAKKAAETKTRRKRKRAAFFANLSFYSLLLAGIGFVIVGDARLGRRADGAPQTMVAGARAAISSFGYTGAWDLRSYATRANDSIVLQFVQAHDTLYATMNSSSRQLIDFRAVSSSRAVEPGIPGVAAAMP